MVELYCKLVKENRRTIDQVPAQFREAVMADLKIYNSMATKI